jgi:hypothetical protein
MQIAPGQEPTKRMAAMLCALLLVGCATPPPSGCAANQQRSINELIYFGAATPNGTVTPEQWAAFLAEVVTPRFPAGLTTWDASGQWRSADGSLTREPSHVLNLVHDGNPATESSVLAIIDAYKTRYRQEAVMRVRAPACVSF